MRRRDFIALLGGIGSLSPVFALPRRAGATTILTASEHADRAATLQDPRDFRYVEFVLGPLKSVTDVKALGAIPAGWEAALPSYLEKYWKADDAAWGMTTGETGHNYYDRASIYYREWRRHAVSNPTLAATYKARADAQVVDLRTNFFEANKYAQTFTYLWSYQPSLCLHAHYGDDGPWSRALSASGIGKLADWFCSGDRLAYIGRREPTDVKDFDAWADNRWQGRAIETLTWAVLTEASSELGANFATALRTAVDGALKTQLPDGSWRQGLDFYLAKPWYMGILLDALIEYYTKVSADSRIPPAVKACLDFCWETMWVPQEGGFRYEEGSNSGEWPEAYEVLPVLNNFLVPAFWWYFAYSGETIYRDRGDYAFAGCFNRGPATSKEFNQVYAFLDKAWAWRGDAPFVGQAVNRCPAIDLDDSWHGGSIWMGSFRVLTIERGKGHASCYVEPFPVDTLGTIEAKVKKAGPNGADSVWLWSANTTEDARTGISQKFSTVTGGVDAGDGYRLIRLTGVLLPAAGASSAQLDYMLVGCGGKDDPTINGAVFIADVRVYTGDQEATSPAVPLKSRSGPPFISGTAKVGAMLTVATGLWANEITSYVFQWYRNGVPIKGATSNTYSLVAADRRKTIGCTVAGVNELGVGKPVMAVLETVIT